MANTADIVAQMKLLLPTCFISGQSDEKLAAYIELVVDEINAVTPTTGYTIETMPQSWNNIVAFGASLYANLFSLVEYSLADMSFNDNGLSMTIDRHGKLSSVFDKQMNAYALMRWNLKKCMGLSNGPYGTGYPRFTAQISQFMRLIYGSNFSR